MRITLPSGKWRKRLKIKALPPFAELHKVRAGNYKMFDVNFEFGQGGAERSLKDGHLQEDFPKVEFRSKDCPGGVGWIAEYCGDMFSYFEARFDAPTGLTGRDGSEVNLFRIMVTAPRSMSPQAIGRLPVIAGLLNSFLP